MDADISEVVEEGDVVRIDFGDDYGTHRGEVVGIAPEVGTDGQETVVDVHLGNAGESDYAPSRNYYLIDLVGVKHQIDGKLVAVGDTIHDNVEHMGEVEEFEVIERAE